MDVNDFLKGHNWKYWEVRGIVGTRIVPEFPFPRWVPGDWRPWYLESENALGVFPKQGNPQNPFVIDPFHGYGNQETDLHVIPDIDEFWSDWPLRRNDDSWGVHAPKDCPDGPLR